MPSWWPRHLTLWRVWMAIVLVGAVFIALHGLHFWRTDTCRVCTIMSGK